MDIDLMDVLSESQKKQIGEAMTKRILEAASSMSEDDINKLLLSSIKSGLSDYDFLIENIDWSPICQRIANKIKKSI